MLRKITHEVLPYLCITAGLEVVLLIASPVAWVIGGVIFAYGAYLWIHYHRAKAVARRRGLPEFLYEAAPFLYILAGTLCMLTFMHYQGQQLLPVTLTGALLFYLAGFGAWLMRAVTREKQNEP